MSSLTKLQNPKFKDLYDSLSVKPLYPIDSPAIVDTTEYGPKSRYKGNRKIKNAGTKTSWTPEMIEEYRRCKEDILYFAERYFWLIDINTGERGLVKLYDFQREILRLSQNNSSRFMSLLQARQSGKSSVITIALLHYALFNKDKEIILLANKADTAHKILKRLREALQELPFFLQPGCQEYNKSTIEFENQTVVYAAASANESIRGSSPHILYLDEMAFVPNDKDFMAAVLPAILAGKEKKVWMSSTPNGMGNVFHETCERASHGENDYLIYKVTWDMVPGRDDEWKREAIDAANGSLAQFRQEQECIFRGSTTTLIDSDSLGSIQALMSDEIAVDTIDPVHMYVAPIEGHKYVMSVDVSGGVGGDHSTFSIFDISTSPYEQVFTFSINTISPYVFPTMIEKWGKRYNSALVLIENNNDFGFIVTNIMHEEIEYDNIFKTNNVNVNGIGVKTTAKVKGVGCRVMKDMIEQHTLKINDPTTYKELCTFEAKGNSWAASKNNHDDMVSTLWLFGWLTSHQNFKEYLLSATLTDSMFSDTVSKISEEDSMYDNYEDSWSADNRRPVDTKSDGDFW